MATWGAGVFTIHNPSSGAPTVQAVPGAPVIVQELAGLGDGDVWGAAYDTGVGVITASGWATKLVSGGERYMSIDGYVSGGVDTVIAGSDNSQPVSGQPGLHAVLHETANSGATWTSLPQSNAQVSKLLGPQESTWWHASYAPALLGSQTMVPSSIALEHERGGDDLWVAGYGGNWRLLGAEGQSIFYPSDDGLGSTVNHQIALDPTTSGQSRSGQRVYLGDTDWGMFSSADGFSTQQGISDDQFIGGGTDAYDTVVDGAVSPPVVYAGVGNRDSNTQGDVMSAAAPATASTSFQSLGLATATGGGRPLALGVVDTGGTPTVIVAVEASGLWTRVGSGAWTRDTSLFATDEPPVAAIATGSGAQAGTVYAYDRTIGVYRSLDAGAPGSWTLIWKHASLAAVPFLMVDGADPTRLWVSAVGGLYRLDGAASSTFASLSPVIAGTTAGLGELGSQVFTTQVAGANLELEVSDASGANFGTLGEMDGMPANASSIAVAGDGTVYIATTGWGVIVGTPVELDGNGVDLDARSVAIPEARDLHGDGHRCRRRGDTHRRRRVLEWHPPARVGEPRRLGVGHLLVHHTEQGQPFDRRHIPGRRGRHRLNLERDRPDGELKPLTLVPTSEPGSVAATGPDRRAGTPSRRAGPRCAPGSWRSEAQQAGGGRCGLPCR